MPEFSYYDINGASQVPGNVPVVGSGDVDGTEQFVITTASGSQEAIALADVAQYIKNHTATFPSLANLSDVTNASLPASSPRGSTILSNGDFTWQTAAPGVWAGGRNFLRDSGATVDNNVGPVTLMAGSYSIPANTLHTGDSIRVRASGNAHILTTGHTLQWKLAIGGVNVFNFTSDATVTGSANAHKWFLDESISVKTLGAAGTSVMAASGTVVLGASSTTTADVCDGVATNGQRFMGGTFSWDTTVNAAITLTLTASSAAAGTGAVCNEVLLAYSPFAQFDAWIAGTSIPSPLVVTTSTIPAGTVGTAYTSTTFAATGGTSPYTWDIAAGTLPTSMTFSAAGVLSGTPAAGGSWPGTNNITFRVTDTARSTATLLLAMTIAPSGASSLAVTVPSNVLPGAQVGQTVGQYAVDLSQYVTGGTAPYTYSRSALRTVTDAVTNATTTVTSAAAGFLTSDVGAAVTGTNIPVGATIASRTNGTTVVLSAAAVGSGTGGTLNIGLSPTLPFHHLNFDGAHSITNTSTLVSTDAGTWVERFRVDDSAGAAVVVSPTTTVAPPAGPATDIAQYVSTNYDKVHDSGTYAISGLAVDANTNAIKVAAAANALAASNGRLYSSVAGTIAIGSANAAGTMMSVGSLNNFDLANVTFVAAPNQPFANSVGGAMLYVHDSTAPIFKLNFDGNAANQNQTGGTHGLGYYCTALDLYKCGAASFQLTTKNIRGVTGGTNANSQECFDMQNRFGAGGDTGTIVCRTPDGSGHQPAFTLTGVIATRVLGTCSFTSTKHGVVDGQSVKFTSIGSLTGVDTVTTYYVVGADGNDDTFAISAAVEGTALAIGGTSSTVNMSFLAGPGKATSGPVWHYIGLGVDGQSSPLTQVQVNSYGKRHGCGTYCGGNVQWLPGSGHIGCDAGFNVEEGDPTASSNPHAQSTGDVTIGDAAGATFGQVYARRCAAVPGTYVNNSNQTVIASHGVTINRNGPVGIKSVNIYGLDTLFNGIDVFITQAKGTTGSATVNPTRLHNLVSTSFYDSGIRVNGVGTNQFLNNTTTGLSTVGAGPCTVHNDQGTTPTPTGTITATNIRGSVSGAYKPV